MKTYESYIQVAGAQHYRPAALKLMKARRASLALQRERRNPHDSNAIKVIAVVPGWIFTKRYHVGYIPASVAARIVDGHFWPNVEAELRNVKVGEYVNIVFDLLGPDKRKKEYVAMGGGRARFE